MPIYNGTNKLKDIYYGNNKIGSVYYGNNLVYTSYREVDLGLVDINATGSYKWNYYCDAHAILIYDHGTQKLKITGKWYSKGDAVSGNVTAFSTNINVGEQKQQITIVCNCWYNTTSTSGSRYATYNGKITTDGTVYLTLGHESVYRTFNQYDYDQTLIELDPV